MSRSFIASLLVIACVVATYKVWRSDSGYAYRHYFASTDTLNLDFEKLTAITIAETKEKYPAQWWCRNEQSRFGDQFCTSDLKAWNEVPAMSVVFWYKNGLLSSAKIDVPYWHHKTLINSIYKHYSGPIKWSRSLQSIIATEIMDTFFPSQTKHRDNNDFTIKRLAIWQLKSGAWLMTETTPGPNPFKWNTVFWMSPEVTNQHKADI